MATEVKAARAEVQRILDAGYAIDAEVAELRERKRNLGLTEAVDALNAAEAAAARGETLTSADVATVEIGTATEATSNG